MAYLILVMFTLSGETHLSYFTEMPPIHNLVASSLLLAASSTHPPTPAITSSPCPSTDDLSSYSLPTSPLSYVLLPANVLPVSTSDLPNPFSISLINLSPHKLSVILAIAITTSVLFAAILCWLVVVQVRLSRVIRREQTASNTRSSLEREKKKRRSSAPPFIRLDIDGITPFSIPTTPSTPLPSTRKSSLSPSNHSNGETHHSAVESPSNSPQAGSPIDSVCTTRGERTVPLTHNCNAETRSPYPLCHATSIYPHDLDLFDPSSQPPSYSNIELSLPSPMREEEAEGPSSSTTAAMFGILSSSIPPLSPIIPHGLSPPSRPRLRPLPPLPSTTGMPLSSSPSPSNLRIIHPSTSISSFGTSSVLSSPSGMTPAMTPLDLTPHFSIPYSLPMGGSSLLGGALKGNHSNGREGVFVQFHIPPAVDDESYSDRPLLTHSSSTASSSWSRLRVRRMVSSTSSLQALSLAHSNWDVPSYSMHFATVPGSDPFSSLDSSLDSPSHSVSSSPSREGFKAVPLVMSSSTPDASSCISSFIQPVPQADE